MSEIQRSFHCSLLSPSLIVNVHQNLTTQCLEHAILQLSVKTRVVPPMETVQLVLEFAALSHPVRAVAQLLKIVPTLQTHHILPRFQRLGPVHGL